MRSNKRTATYLPYCWNKGLLWTIIYNRLIKQHAQDPTDTHQLVTYSPIKPQYILGVFSLAMTLSLGILLNPSTDAMETDYNVINTVNSQGMSLLTPSFSTQVPKAIGGPVAPYIEDGTLHPHIGMSSTIATQVEQDEDGISYYIVQKGDTVSEIAELFGVSTNTITWENNIGKSIKPGQELKILPVTGIRHKIKKGDTISKIATTYDVEQEDVTIYNGIDESKLVVGELIIIPNGVKQKVSSPTVSKTTITQSGTSSSVSNGYYIRPTSGKTTSRFGPRSRGYHYGIDYGAPTGTPIVAAASGTVLKTSCGSGYGKCLVIQHDNGTQTLYAHASVLYVSSGTQVKQGQKIAAVGSTGRSTGPHLHFEIIKSNGQKLNPDKYISN